MRGKANRSKAQGRAGAGTRAAATVLALLATFAALPSAAGAVTLDGARTKALNATKAERARGGVILFGLRAPVRARAAIREAGRRPPSSGSSTRSMRLVLTAGREPAYFFYLDRGAHQAYEHLGRVILVGARSGRVTRSRTIRFAPTIDGRLPVFLRSREGYELPAYRVASTDYAVAGAARAASLGPGPLGARAAAAAATPRSVASERLVASTLAAEKSCTIAIGRRRSAALETLGSPSGSRVLPLLVYDPASARSFAAFVASEAIGRRGCRDILIAISGDGYGALSPPSTRAALSTTGRRMREYHVSVAMLRSIIASNPSVTFKLMLDGPGAAGYVTPLKALANVLLIATSSGAGQTAFRYLPQKSISGEVTGNPLRMRADSSFLTTQLFGAAAFAASDAEVVHAAGEVAAGRAPSFLAYMIARGFALSRPFDFTADVGATQGLYTSFPVTAPGPANHPPVAHAAAVTTAEDTAVPIALSAGDLEGNPLTYTVGVPAHGTLSGTAPNLTYTPAPNYNGPDSFTFSVSDGSLISATATVSITVTAVDDPPVTTASGTLPYTENDPPTPIAPALTVTDVDSANLTGATVQITANYVGSDDRLALPAQPAITAAFDAASGTLTLSGSASVAAYQAALRAVTYENTSHNPPNAPRTVTFRSRDAGGFGPSATRTITITPVNDPPVVTTSAGPLSYTEAAPATPIDPGLTLTDPDSQISGATVRITGNLASGEDVLALASPTAGISAVYTAATGTLTLSGTASVAAYQAALQAVTYRNTSSNPSTLQRTVSFQATDTAAAASNVATRAINITATDNPPVVDNSAGALAYTENDPAKVIDPTITIIDVDSANLTGATVRITGNYVQGQDILGAPGGLPGAITAAFDAATGTLTLSGTASVANYDLALELVHYANTSDNPSTATRTVTYQARDTGGFGAADTRGITITAVDDPPVAVNDAATVGEDSGTSAVPVLANDTDVDAGLKSIGSVTQPANGTVLITGGGTGLTYVPNPNYCNSPPGTAPDTFTYTLAPGGSTATVSVTVTCADDPPVAVNDSATVGEDSGAGTLDVLANDTDIDGGPKSVSSVTQPANGTVVNNGTSVSYTPNPNYCNSPPGTTPDTFTYALNFGSTATVSMTVACSDDPPVAVSDSVTVGEDSSSNAIDVLANDTDVDGGPITVGSVTQPANGSVVITGGGTGVSYTPNADYCNSPPGTSPDTFTYTLNGGSTAIVSVMVTCGGDAPNVTTSAGFFAYTENDPATPVDPGVTVTDSDPGATITGATVAITSNFAAEDVLALANPLSHPLITAGFAGNKLTLSGTASPAQYQAALRDVTYVNTSQSPSTLTRTLTFTVTDDTALSDSATRNVQVTSVEDAPVAVNDTETVGEDSGSNTINVLANDTDVDGGPISVASASDPANGTVVSNGTDVSYTPDANYCNNPPGTAPDTFTYTLNGGSTATVSVTVTCAADNPVVDTSTGTLAYTEDDPATPIDPNVTVTDPDSGAMITGATVAITTNFAAGQDVLALGGVHPGISAMFVGDTLTLSGTATPLAYQAALRDVTYANTSQGPLTLARTVTFTVTDDTALSGSDTRGITVAGVNDPPTAVDDSDTTDEDTPLNRSAPGVLANDTDVDPGDTKTVVELNGSGTLTGSSAKGGSVTINANGSYTYVPPSAFQALSTGQSDTDSFQYTMADGAGAQSTATVNLTVNGVSDAPTAVADTYDAVGNTGLFVGTSRPATEPGKEITGSILANDTDPDTPQANLSVVAETKSTTGGGSVTLEADGNFTYHPDDGDLGADTFTYTVSDGVASATGTVTITLTGQVWYVRNNQPAGGDGTSDAPFDTLLEAETASGTADTVYVFDGNNTTTNLDTGYVMAASERLIGESRPLTLDPDGGGALPAVNLYPGTSGAQPTLTASNEDVIVLASDALVDGIDVDPSGSGGGISGGPGIDAVTVSNVNVTDTGTAGTEPGIELNGTTGVNRFTGVTVTNGAVATAIGVKLLNAGSVLFANTATNTIATTGAKALDAQSTNLLTSRWNEITVTGSGTGAIRLNNTSGQPALGDGAGIDLQLQTTSGATAALDIASSPGVSLAIAGTNTISATGGPAVDIRNSNGSQFFFDSVSSTNSAGDGINFDTNLGSPFVASAGAISGADGIGVDINGGGAAGPANFIYSGPINDGPGPLSVEVTGRDGGQISLGDIADGPDAGGGIVVSNNSGGSTAFASSSKVLNTGASDAVVLGSNGSTATGHTVSFINGGLDIDTTSGRGFSSTGGGRVQVTHFNNTITTGTGTALTVDSSGITTPGLHFGSIASNGAVNGIRLNNTGPDGGLSVIGIGGTCTSAASCTGGAIQNSTGDGVSLTNVPGGVTLHRVSVNNSAEDGVDAVSVAGLTVDASSILSNGNAAEEEGIALSQVTGAIAITGTNVSNSGYNNLRLDNTSGTVSSLSLTNSKFNTNSATTGNHGALVEFRGTSALTAATVSGSEFKDNFSIGLQLNVADTANVAGFTVNNNTFTGTSTGATSGTQEIAVDVSKSGTSNVTFAVTNNAGIVGHNSHAMNFFTAAGAGNAGMYRGRITGNTIGTAGTASSGSQIGNCMRVVMQGNSTNTLLIDSNVLRQCPNGRGIEAVGRNGIGTTDITVTNNDVNPQAPANALAAILVQSNCVSICATVRSDVRGNVVPAASDVTDFLTTYIQLVESGASTLQLVDTAPASANCTAQLTSTNTGSSSATAGCALIAGPINTPP